MKNAVQPPTTNPTMAAVVLAGSGKRSLTALSVT
ncbi:hypothetical protein VPHK469_0165 [Vibrio phage K469]